MNDRASSKAAVLELIPCPDCRSERHSEWAREREHTAAAAIAGCCSAIPAPRCH